MSDDQLHVLAEEQAALRRVATLVAQGVRPADIFAAVSEEADALFGVGAAVLRFDDDGPAIVFVGISKTVEVPIGTRWEFRNGMASAEVYRTARSARVDAMDWSSASGPVAVAGHRLGIVSTVVSPIVVEGRLWGAMSVSSTDLLLPVDTEGRLEKFTELVATAIANAESRAELARLAEEQAALRRVATLVARGIPPDELFSAVTKEVGRLLGTQLAGMARYNSDDTLTVLATWADEGEHPLAAGPWPLERGDLASTIARTGRPVRIDDDHGVPGRIAAFLRDELGINSSVGSPILVEGRLWGALFVQSKRTHQPLPQETEARLASFTELVATAIANAQSRAELMASRARIVAAADETRRRIERDLHDGIQQRLVSLGLEVRAAAAQPGEVTETLARVAEELASVFDQLREIAHGIHPAILSEGGLEPALRALRRRSAVPVELNMHVERRLPEPVEVATYYVVSEGLANAAKHATASMVTVDLDTDDTAVRLTIRDDGIGGADRRQGTGLLGLSDRVAALGGTLEITSPAGKGTTLLINVPLQHHSGTAAPQP